MPFNAVAKGFVYFFNAGICVPGLRDIFATGKPLNDNDALLYPIVCPEKKIGESMVWKTWGMFAISLAIMKIMAMWLESVPFTYLGIGYNTAVAINFAIHEKGIGEATGGKATILPFIVLFALEDIAMLVCLFV